jgi:MFS family permease
MMLGRYLVGAASARLGDEASGPALLLAALAVTGSPAPASALLATLTVTTAAGGPVLGALLDRAASPGRLLAAALTGYAAGLVALAAALGRAPQPWLLAIAAGTGFFGPALTGGWTSRLAGFGLDGRGLRRAYAADTASYAVAGLAGPALAGTLAALMGPRAPVLVAAVLLALALPVALALPAATPAPATRNLLAELRAGVGAVFTRARLRAATVTSALSYLGIGAVTAAVPVLGQRLTGQAGIGAALLALLALGSLAGSAVLGRWVPRATPDRQVRVAVAVLAAGLLVVTVAPHVAVAGVGLLVAGLADGPLLSGLLLIRHQEAPDGRRAQVFATAISIKQAGFAVGAALAGTLAVHSLRAGLAVAVLAQCAALVAGTLAGRTVTRIDDDKCAELSARR